TDHCRGPTFGLDDIGHVPRQIVQGEVLHLASAAPNAARLRQEHAVAPGHQLFGNFKEVTGPPPKRGEHDDRFTTATAIDLDGGVAALYQLTLHVFSSSSSRWPEGDACSTRRSKPAPRH